MKIDELIADLLEIKEKYGNVPIYKWVTVDDGYGDFHNDLIELEYLQVSKVNKETYMREEYSYEDDEVIQYEVESYGAIDIDAKTPHYFKNAYIGITI